MMGQRILIMTLLLSMTSVVASAQGFFNQKGSQLKRLAEQIAALQAYKGVLNKGYKIVKTGVKTINGFKEGEYNLHNVFFTSLKTVNPKIKKYVKVGEIIAIDLQILNSCKQTFQQVKKSKQFALTEMTYIDQVFDRLLVDCEAAIDDLIALTTDAKLEMKDDERMEQIDQIYDDMQGMNAFCKKFSNETLMLGTQRWNEDNQLKMMKTWHGIAE